MLAELNPWMMAIIVVLVLLGALVAQAIMIPQSAEARGCNNSAAFDASQGPLLPSIKEYVE